MAAGVCSQAPKYACVALLQDAMQIGPVQGICCLMTIIEAKMEKQTKPIMIPQENKTLRYT